MPAWIRSNWFLLALAVSYAIGHFGAFAMQAVADQVWLRSALVFAVMWAMGVTLKPDAIRRSLKQPTASVLAVMTNMFLVPMLCFPTQLFLSDPMFGGLMVASLVPCTLASASVWTRKAEGDDSVSMVTTTVTNLACVVVVPVGVWIALAVDAEVPLLAQMKKLALFVVLPMVLAQVMRRGGLTGSGLTGGGLTGRGLGEWADRNKKRISTAAQLGILVMVFFGAIKGRIFSEQSEEALLGSLPLVAIAALAVHLIALGFGVGSAKLMGLPRDQQIAVGISGSQKTLMVGLQIAIDCGVSVLPMLIYHVLQLFADTLIVERWRKRKRRPEAESDANSV